MVRCVLVAAEAPLPRWILCHKRSTGFKNTDDLCAVCLRDSSAVRSGKSVLVIDAVDTYGSECASFTFASLHQALGAQKQSDEPGGAEGAQQRDAAERASSPRHVSNL